MRKGFLFLGAIFATLTSTSSAFAEGKSFVMRESRSTMRSFFTVSGEARDIASVYHAYPSVGSSYFEFKSANDFSVAKATQKRFSRSVTIEVQSVDRRTVIKQNPTTQIDLGYLITDSLGNEITAVGSFSSKQFDHKVLLKDYSEKYGPTFEGRYDFKDKEGNVVAELRRFAPEECSKNSSGMAYTGVIYDDSKINAATMMSIAAFELRNIRSARYARQTIDTVVKGVSILSIVGGSAQMLGLAKLGFYNPGDLALKGVGSLAVMHFGLNFNWHTECY